MKANGVVYRILEKKIDPFPIPANYDYSKSTEINYNSPDAKFVGKYQKIRAQLDYTYHLKYSEERQHFQDLIVDKFQQTVVYDEKNNWYCESPMENWIVFTAGVMGAGKGHTMHWLQEEKLFPMEAFVHVDPDAIRHLLPEFEKYNSIDHMQTGFLTQKEVGYISEILSYCALDRRKNVLIDGSLRDAHWYLKYFKNLRDSFPTLKLSILHVDAPIATILERAHNRAQVTGRYVPDELIIQTARELPDSLAILVPHVEYFARLMNENKKETFLDYCEMKRRIDASSYELQKIWELSRYEDVYKCVDHENKEERLEHTWKFLFSEVWEMRCELPTMSPPQTVFKIIKN